MEKQIEIHGDIFTIKEMDSTLGIIVTYDGEIVSELVGFSIDTDEEEIKQIISNNI